MIAHLARRWRVSLVNSRHFRANLLITFRLDLRAIGIVLLRKYVRY
jgi:hypothetical protein